MFYHYSQNNSGGSFVFRPKDGISHHVIIEANTERQANSLAEGIGLYFDGEGDCNCCGNRWSEFYGEADAIPQVYGEAVVPNSLWVKSPKTFNIKWIDGPEGYIHYLDGRIEPFWDGKRKQ